MKTGVAGVLGMVLACAAVPAATESGLEEPGCDALTVWAKSLQPGQTFEVRPGVAVSTLFRDDQLVPLFGKPVSAWERDDVGALRGRAGECRKQAYTRKDKASGEALYAVMKLAQNASRGLRPVWAARRQVDNVVERLVAQQPSPEVSEILAIARDALAGQEVEARVAALPGRYRGKGRQAAQIGEHAPMLASSEIAFHTARLEERLAEAGSEVAEQQEAHAALLREIMSIPATDAGYARLKQISYNADRNAMSREELASFNAAMARKADEIRRAAAARQAQAAAEARQPIDLAQHLAGVFTGERLRGIELGGLHPGLPRARAVTVLRGPSWRLDHEGALPSANKFVPRREDGRRLKSERRSGAWVALDVNGNERVGQIVYEERFRARVRAAEAQRWLMDGYAGRNPQRAQWTDPELAGRRSSNGRAHRQSRGHVLEGRRL